MRKVPKLRFKEFSDEWKEKKLGEISEIIMGQSPDSKNYNEKNIGLPLIQGNADCKNRKVYPRLYTSEITKESIPNDIIMTVRAPVGAIAFSNIHSCIGRGVCAIRNTNNFIYHYLIKLENSWEKISQGSTFTAVNSNDIKKLQLILPNIQEQEKIANFLTNIDKKISLIEEKLELFKNYKKGVMQNIFSQELRFKDNNGNDYPEWEEKRLGDILIKNKEKNKNNQYTLVQSISNKYGFVNQEEYFEDRKIASNNLSNYYIIKNKNFAYNPSRINVGSLAYKKDFSISVISPLYVSFYADNSYVNDIFLLNWLFSFPFYRQMNSSFEGSVRNNLSYDALSSFNILLPILEEQQKIADFLSSIDNKIESIEKELEGLKEFKKGLFQQMFV